MQLDLTIGLVRSPELLGVGESLPKAHNNENGPEARPVVAMLKLDGAPTSCSHILVGQLSMCKEWTRLDARSTGFSQQRQRIGITLPATLLGNKRHSK